jgi:hypothetical protein
MLFDGNVSDSPVLQQELHYFTRKKSLYSRIVWWDMVGKAG